MSEPNCPKCQLPIDHGAWHCDGCGHEFSQDIEGVRSRLQHEVAASRRGIWVTLLVDIALTGGVVYLATLGFFYISVPLAVTVVGSIGYAFHRRSVAREHLSEFTRRHAPLPTATARSASA